MKFLLDANLPGQLANVFIDAAHDCAHMESVLPRYSADMEIVRAVNESGAVVVSRDADFVQFSKDGTLTVPLVWIRLGNIRRTAMASAIRARLSAVVRSLEAGETIVEIR
jgi:predicted nuclease of predicted toxin-antitoxin system